MTNIIILLSIVFLIYEIKNLFYTLEYDKQITKIKIDIKDGYLNPNDRPFIIFNMIYFIWSVFGLFTEYSPIFIAFILFSTLVAYLHKTEDVIKRLMRRKFDALISIIFLTILLLKHYL